MLKAKAWTPGYNMVKDHFPLLPSQHMADLVPVLLSCAQHVCTKTVQGEVKISCPPFSNRRSNHLWHSNTSIMYNSRSNHLWHRNTSVMYNSRSNHLWHTNTSVMYNSRSSHLWHSNTSIMYNSRSSDLWHRNTSISTIQGPVTCGIEHTDNA